MILQFDVINQKILRRDNNYIVANSQFYLQMDFNFTVDWQGFGKTITFVGNGKKFSIGLNSQDSCVVPWEVIKTPSFSFSIKGILDDVVITTNVMVVSIQPSGETRGVTPSDPPKEIYDGLQNGLEGQVLGKLSDDNYDYGFKDLKDFKYDNENTLEEKINDIESKGIQDVFYQDQKLWKKQEDTDYEIVELYTKEEIDQLLENLDNYIQKSDTPGLIKNDGTIDTNDYALSSDLNSHTSNINNPHSVTAEQVGLGSVVNTGDSNIPTENGTNKFTNGGAYTLKTQLESSIAEKAQLFIIPNMDLQNWVTNEDEEFAEYDWSITIYNENLVGALYVSVLFTHNQILGNNICGQQIVDNEVGTITFYSNDSSRAIIPAVYVFKTVE